MSVFQKIDTPSEWRQQAHDIKNIMATISLVAEELGTGASPRAQTLSRRLERSCLRILEICGAGHDLAPDASQGQFLYDVIEDVATLAKGLAETEVEVVTTCDAVAICEETGAAVFRILANLATNAVGAIAGREGHIELVARARGDRIVITVADNGPGLGAKHRRDESSGLPSRSGMGLTIASTLAGRIDGELTLVRTGPDGTVFKLVFPCIPATAV